MTLTRQHILAGMTSAQLRKAQREQERIQKLEKLIKRMPRQVRDEVERLKQALQDARERIEFKKTEKRGRVQMRMSNGDEWLNVPDGAEVRFYTSDFQYLDVGLTRDMKSVEAHASMGPLHVIGSSSNVFYLWLDPD